MERTYPHKLCSAGVLVFNMYLRSVPLRKIFLWICLACTAAGFTQLLLVTGEALGLHTASPVPCCSVGANTQGWRFHAGANRSLGIPDKVFVAVDSVLVDALTRVALMPVLVLAAKICPVVCPLALHSLRS